MYRILNYTRIKPRSRPPQKKSAYFTHPDFSVAKIGRKVHKLRKQIWYFFTYSTFLVYTINFVENKLNMFHIRALKV